MYPLLILLLAGSIALLVSILSQGSIYKIYLSKTNFHQFQKDFHQDNLSFTYLYYKYNRLYLFEGNILCLIVWVSNKIHQGGIIKIS